MVKLTLSSRTYQGWIVVALHGDLDLHTARLHRDDLLYPCSTPGARLVFDLSALQFCDAAGLRLLLEAQRRATRATGTLALAGPDPVVVKVLRSTGLDHAFTIFRTVADALAPNAPSTDGPRVLPVTAADAGAAGAPVQPSPGTGV